MLTCWSRSAASSHEGWIVAGTGSSGRKRKHPRDWPSVPQVNHSVVKSHCGVSKPLTGVPSEDGS